MNQSKIIWHIWQKTFYSMSFFHRSIACLGQSKILMTMLNRLCRYSRQSQMHFLQTLLVLLSCLRKKLWNRLHHHVTEILEKIQLKKKNRKGHEGYQIQIWLSCKSIVLQIRTCEIPRYVYYETMRVSHVCFPLFLLDHMLHIPFILSKSMYSTVFFSPSLGLCMMSQTVLWLW